MMHTNFAEYVKIHDAAEKLGAFLTEADFSWVKDYHLPDINLDLPCVEKKSKITMIFKSKNPILIALSDGSSLYLTFDEFKRIQVEPEIGKTMVVKFLRLPNDTSNTLSKIQSCQVI